ncbi:MAG: DUF4388 domain-containing protein [Deltaproteobacteria bacterium]|nr:DUF4388 domain-containing protein [Deltaproteobacteria bacterium]MCL5277389.1 DUF4388 domain-containing protein [Deltaproteobacteria bacterium]
MVLKGSLGTFDVASIIQMITSQQATGVLHIRSGDKKSAFDIMIDNGRLVRIIPVVERSRKPAAGAAVGYIADRLMRAGLIDTGQLKVLLHAVKKEGLNEYLIPERFSVPVTPIKRLIATITYESLHRMHGMKTGSYEFEPQTVEYNPGFCEPMSAEFVLMESLRVVDEVSHINRVYGDGLVFGRDGTAGPAAGQRRDKEDAPAAVPEESWIEKASVPVGPPRPERPSPEETKSSRDTIIGLVNDKSTLLDIYYRSLLSKSEVVLELDRLLNEGRIAILSQGVPAMRPPGSAVLAGVFSAAGSLLMLILTVCILSAVVYFSDISPFRQTASRVDVTYVHILGYMGRYQRIKLSNALEIYKLEHGSYPASLKALVDTHIIRSKDLTFPYGNEYYYTIEGEGYVLLAPEYP